jgi:sacsin
MFRLPLRTSAAAAASDIKPSPCPPEEAWALLGALARELPRALLFLKTVRSVEISVISPEDEQAEGSEPRLIMRATIESPQHLQAPMVQFVAGGGGGTGQQQLAAFFQRLGAAPSEQLPAAAGRVRLAREWGDAALRARMLEAAAAGERRRAGAGGANQAREQEQGRQQSTGTSTSAALSAGPDEEQFLVLNALGAGAARAAALAAWKESGRKFIPWVGIGAPLGGGDEGDARDAAGGARARAAPVGEAAGRAFCFLPLPVATGLPVAVNGYFELSSNRRDVWHGEDMAGAGAARARWNEALLSDAVAPAYLQLLSAAARELGPSPALWAMFPGADAPEPWAAVSRALYRLLTRRPLLWCPAPAPKGAWLAPTAALLPDAAALADGRLRGLMLAVGVPLVEGLGREARECLLQWTPGARQVGGLVGWQAAALNPGA